MPSTIRIEELKPRSHQGQKILRYRIRYGQYSGVVETTAHGDALFYSRYTRLGDVLLRNAFGERGRINDAFVQLGKPRVAVWIAV